MTRSVYAIAPRKSLGVFVVRLHHNFFIHTYRYRLRECLCQNVASDAYSLWVSVQGVQVSFVRQTAVVIGHAV